MSHRREAIDTFCKEFKNKFINFIDKNGYDGTKLCEYLKKNKACIYGKIIQQILFDLPGIPEINIHTIPHKLKLAIYNHISIVVDENADIYEDIKLIADGIEKYEISMERYKKSIEIGRASCRERV